VLLPGIRTWHGRIYNQLKQPVIEMDRCHIRNRFHIMSAIYCSLFNGRLNNSLRHIPPSAHVLSYGLEASGQQKVSKCSMMLNRNNAMKRRRRSTSSLVEIMIFVGPASFNRLVW
jgi:hypothetical protein